MTSKLIKDCVDAVREKGVDFDYVEVEDDGGVVVFYKNDVGVVYEVTLERYKNARRLQTPVRESS